jgi:hypothetical protein
MGDIKQKYNKSKNLIAIYLIGILGALKSAIKDYERKIYAAY